MRDLAHRRHAMNRLRRLDLQDRAADVRDHRARRELVIGNDEPDRIDRKHRARQIDLGHRPLRETIVADVTSDADDLEARTIRSAEATQAPTARRSGQYVRAAVSLITTNNTSSDPRPSCAVRKRPARSGMRIVRR